MTIVVVSLLLIGANFVVHGVGTTLWLRYLVDRKVAAPRFRNRDRMWLLILTAVVLIALHFVEILMWAVCYLLVTPGELPSLEAAVYFSAVTFSTLGYGDITLSDGRLMSGFEAITGILLVGWSTAFIFTVLQHTWGQLLSARKAEGEGS